MCNYLIRAAVPGDANALLDLYAPYVRETAITFEYEVPSLAEFRSRIRNTLVKYPYLVAEADGTLLGYAYARAFVGRQAYDWAAESSIYLRRDRRGLGLGRALYQTLEQVLAAQNILNLNACIAYPEQEDEYLTRNSAEFHAHLGFRMVGTFHQCGYKFGRWYNMIWMEKTIGSHPDHPSPVTAFPDLPPESLAQAGVTL